MRQDKIYWMDDNAGNNFWAIANESEVGMTLFIFGDEPSKYTEEEQALAIVQIEIEQTDCVRVLARIWNDETDKRSDASEIYTLIQQEEVDFQTQKKVD